MTRRFLLNVLKTETAAGGALALAGLCGLAAANSSWANGYFATLAAPVTLGFGPASETLSVLGWIKEGLMTLFFFAVGLELKFEAVRGDLSSRRRLALPVAAALGGMSAPALVYLAADRAWGAGAPQGWPVPVATDVAFALAALALAGRRAPSGLRTFLLALAVIDDLGAVLLIALLFSHGLHLGVLAAAGGVLAALMALGRWRGAPAWLFGLGAFILWALTLRSGVSPSVAGVAAALCVPLRPRAPGQASLLEAMLERVQPWVAWLVLPAFAFAAAGVRLQGAGAAVAGAAAVAVALILGKPAGVLGAAALAVRLRLARLPRGVGWSDMAAGALLCGVGFTMSLYLSALAFQGEPGLEAGARLGVLAGSLGASTAALAWLFRARRTRL